VLGLFDAYKNALLTNSMADTTHAKDDDVMFGGKKQEGKRQRNV